MAAKKSSAAASAAPAASDSLMNLVWFGAVAYALFLFLVNAYVIRMQAIQEYGPVIHEFDPYFNWRATQVCIILWCWKYFTMVCCPYCCEANLI